MGTLVDEVFKAKPDALMMVAGLVFLLLAVIGNITGKIQPGKVGRIAAGVLGAIFFSSGFVLHWKEDVHPADGRPTPTPTPIRTPTPSPAAVRFPSRWNMVANGYASSLTLKLSNDVTVRDSFNFAGSVKFDNEAQEEPIVGGTYDGGLRTISFQRLLPDHRRQWYSGSLDASSPNKLSMRGGFQHEGVPGTFEWHMVQY